MLTGLVMFYFRCRKGVATLQPVTICELLCMTLKKLSLMSTDDEDMTLMTRAEDVTGKPFCIVYKECLLELARMEVIIGI